MSKSIQLFRALTGFRSLKLPALAAFGALVSLTACVSTGQEKGFVSLFDGQSLAGWTYVGEPAQRFVVEDGLLVSPARSHGTLYSEAEYKDFVLRLEYRLGPGGNNGVGLRAPLGAPGDQVAFTGLEVQILDNKAPRHANIKPWQANGSVYGIFPAQNSDALIGDWNAMEITARGRRIKIVLNGRTVVEGNLNDVRDVNILRKHTGMLRDSGRIALMGHNDRVEFRNIRIKELPAEPVKDNTAPDGFVAMFNGRDLTGWKGLVGGPPKRAEMSPAELAEAQKKADELMRQNWRIESGALVYAGKAFDNLVSEKEYGNFELLVDWKIEPPKGDSGLYLRGTPQVQIWAEAEGSGGLWNNKNNPGKPIKRADNPVGSWNTFRILMTGDKVTIHLNETLIVDNVTLENYWEKGKPLHETGPIELQAHRDKVYFKNIYVREIPRP